MSTITVTVGRDGKATIKVEGIRDGSCRKRTKKLEEDLGGVRLRQSDGGVAVSEQTKVGN